MQDVRCHDGDNVETTKFATHRHGTAISTLRPRAFIGNSSGSTSQVGGEIMKHLDGKG